MTFTFNFTQDKLSQILHNNHQVADWFVALNTALPKYNIVTPEQVAEFFAQTAHESSNYNVLLENLNYSAAGLSATFPNRFPTVVSALPFARQPMKIANSIYANRLGNGPPESGDGWKYRGRGIIQITGKSNYAAASQFLFQDLRLVDNPDLVLDKNIAIETACWFWTSHNLNELVNQANFREVTHRINGGYLGEDDREANYKEFLAILKA